MGLAEQNPVYIVAAGLALSALLASTGHLAIAFARSRPIDAQPTDDDRKLRDITLLAGTFNLVSLALAGIAWLGVAFLPFALIPYGTSLALGTKLDRLAPNTGDQAKAGAMNSIWLGGMSGWFLIALPALKEWPFLGEIILLVTVLVCTFLNWDVIDQHLQGRLHQGARRGLFGQAFASAFRPGSTLSIFFALLLSGQARDTGVAGQEMFVAFITSALTISAWCCTARILKPEESGAGEFLTRLGIGLGCFGAIFIGLPTSAVSQADWTMAGVGGALFGLFLIMLIFLSATHWFWVGRREYRQYRLISFLALVTAILAFFLWLPVMQGVRDFERLAGVVALCLVFACLPKGWIEWGGRQVSGQPLRTQDGNRIET